MKNYLNQKRELHFSPPPPLPTLSQKCRYKSYSFIVGLRDVSPE